MALFARSETGIGRGERAESRLEVPFFAVAMVFSAIGLFLFHVFVGNNTYTVALGICFLTFGITVIRVEIGIYILVLAMLLSPEIGAGSVGAAGERAINLRYDDVLIIVIFMGVLVKLAFEGRVMLWRPNPINSGILLYYGICIVATLDALRISVPSWDRAVAFFVMLKMLEFYMIYFMVGLAITTATSIRRQLVFFMFVALIISSYGIFTIGTLDRIGAPFEAGGIEPNTLGGYLSIVIVVALSLFLYAPRRRQKALLFGLAAAAFIPMIWTLSRASYMAVVAGLVALAILSKRALFAVVLVVFIVLSPFFMPDKAVERVRYTFQQESGVPVTIAGRETNLKVDKSTYERIYVWQKVRFNLGVWPWLGGGVAWETVLDSQYARVLIETGILGMTAFSFLLVQILRTTHQAFRWSRDWIFKGLALGVTAATVGLMVHAMGTISFLIVRIMEPFWFLVALTVALRAIALEDHAKRVREYREKQARIEEESIPESQSPPLPAVPKGTPV